MTYEQALELVKREVATGTSAGVAFVALLEGAEIEHYRKSVTSADALVTATICGRGQGVQSILKRIVPTAKAAAGIPGDLPSL